MAAEMEVIEWENCDEEIIRHHLEACSLFSNGDVSGALKLFLSMPSLCKNSQKNEQILAQNLQLKSDENVPIWPEYFLKIAAKLGEKSPEIAIELAREGLKFGEGRRNDCLVSSDRI